LGVRTKEDQVSPWMAGGPNEGKGSSKKGKKKSAVVKPRNRKKPFNKWGRPRKPRKAKKNSEIGVFGDESPKNGKDYKKGKSDKKTARPETLPKIFILG